MVEVETLETQIAERIAAEYVENKRHQKRLLALGFAANVEQQKILADKRRIKLISGGEQAGKSVVTALDFLDQYPFRDAKKDHRLGFLVAPKYESAFPEFDYISNALMETGELEKDKIRRPAQGQASFVTRDGVTLRTISSEDGAKAITGTGKAPCWLGMVEAGKQSYDIFLACFGRATPANASLILSGTIEESEPWYPQKINEWQAENPIGAKSYILPTWTNKALYPLGEEDPKILALRQTYSPDKFLERFGAVPCPPSTLVFREFSYEKHVRVAPYWEAVKIWQDAPVELAVDPGYAGAYAVLAIQWIGDTVYVIDEIYETGVKEQEIIAIAKKRDWWKLVRGGVEDIAGRAHPNAKDSTQEVWKAIRDPSHPSGVYLRGNYIRIPAGIERLRTFLFKPLTGEARVVFDPRCKKTCWELSSGYRYRKVEDGKPVSEDPIDANNHAAKALCYWLYDKFTAVDRPKYIESSAPRSNPFEMR